jgi:acetylornithine deacetylase/succinyl-diaminopimelate desuccinylase-like protein
MMIGMQPENPQSLINILDKLVGFPTVSADLESNRHCLEYVNERLNNLGMESQILHSNEVPSLFAATQPGNKKPKLILQAHMDVVPSNGDGFRMREIDGRLYGRGVFDMKFAAACYLYLVQDLKDELGAYDFGIMLTADEEIGGQNGVGFLLEQGYGGEVCFLPDGGNNWRIEETNNGFWMVKVTANGVSAHGSRPWEGENAISTLVEGLDEIKGMFGALKPGRSSITISQISGGTAANQVPDTAEATLDMRFVEAEQLELYKKAVPLVAENRGLQLTVLAESPCGIVDMDNPHIIDFLLVAEKVHGKPLEKEHSLGGSDARFFAEKDMPVIVMRPTGGGHHGSDEWIDKAEFLKFYELVKTYVMETTKNA